MTADDLTTLAQAVEDAATEMESFAASERCPHEHVPMVVHVMSGLRALARNLCRLVLEKELKP